MALGTYYLPRLSSLVGVDAIVSEIHRTARIVLPIAVILALSIYLLRDVAIWLLFSDEFSSARNLFAIQLCGDVIKIASWLYAYPMLSRGATKWFMATELLSSIIFVILTYFFVSYVGIEGATIAYLVSYFIYFISVFLNVNKFSK